MAGVERIGGSRFAAQWMRSGVLRAALVVSVLAHVAILLGLPELIEAKRQAWFPAPLSARLVQPPPAPKLAERKPDPAPVAAPVVPNVPKPAPRVVPLPAKPAPKPAPVAAESPRSEPVLAAPAQPGAAVGLESAPSSSKAESGAGTAPAASPAAAPAPAFDEAGTIAQYRIALMQVASKLKTYPRIAQENNWQGRVEMRLTIGAGGGITSLAVKSGTGYTVLDQHALDMLRRAQPKTPLPAGLRGREFSLEVPVVFGLKDG